MISKKYSGIPAGYEDDDEEDFDLMDTIQNLKIRVVPDINVRAGLNDSNFDSLLDYDTEIWFKEFQQKWNSCKKTPQIIQELKTVYSESDNMLLLALKLFANCPGCNNLKNKNLALFILETICELRKLHPHMGDACDDNMRMVAFNFIKVCGIYLLYKSVIETYEMHKIKDLLVPKIQELVIQQYYKDASHWAILLNITEKFEIFDIVFPLILQDKIFLAEEYLDVAKNDQQPTIEFLDSLLDKKQAVSMHCDPIILKYKYSDVKQSILSFRPMSKLVARLAKKYKIDPSRTPNLNFSKSRAYMHYLYRKYNEDGMSCDSFRELVRDVANTDLLRQELLINICSYGDFSEALFWAKTFNIPHEKLPESLKQDIQSQQNLAEQQKQIKSNDGTEVFDDCAGDTVDGECETSFLSRKKEEYLQLDLEENSMILIDSNAKFRQMLSVLETQTIISFDSEWKPSACQEESVSLLQLAITDRVYLIDVMETQLQNPDLWKLLGRNIFNNIEILKIGFSINQDMIMLHKSLPHLNLSLQLSSCYLDLKNLWKRLQYMQSFKFPYKRVSYSGESLSALSEICLGKKLDKSNQFSNWANRPLRKDQMVYAALDAYCLIQIYGVIADSLNRIGIHIDHIVDEITTARSVTLKPRKLSTVGVASSSKPVKLDKLNETSRISTTEIKFLCDGMLAGLSKELRKLGIDSIDITNKDNSESIAEKALNEKRFLLTRDSRYLQFSDYLPQNLCIEIPSDTNEKQVINVLQYFNIIVHENNLFSRCLSCNWNEFILARRNHVHKMKPKKMQKNQNDLVDYEQSAADVWIDPYEKTCIIREITDEIVKTRMTYRGVPIKVDKLKPQILQVEEIFYICDNCGLCTWNGAHSLYSKIKEFVVVGSDNVNRYLKQ